MRASSWSLGCAALALVSCATVRPHESNPPSSSSPTAVAPEQAAPDGLRRVVGSAEDIVPWCSGAAPPPGLEVRASPIANAAFLVKAGTENTEREPQATFQTDAEGRFELALPAGEWCVVSSGRGPVRPSRARAEAAAPKVEGSAECADSLWLQCELILDTRGGDVRNARLTRSGRCSWDTPCRRGPPGSPPP